MKIHESHNGMDNREGAEMILRIVRHMDWGIKEFSDEDGMDHTLEQTPAESTAHRLALIDRMRYGGMHSCRRGRRDYYTNSIHVPYNPMGEKVGIEASFHWRSYNHYGLGRPRRMWTC